MLKNSSHLIYSIIKKLDSIIFKTFKIGDNIEKAKNNKPEEFNKLLRWQKECIGSDIEFDWLTALQPKSSVPLTRNKPLGN
mgnify:CR=1 FL=1